MALRVPVRGGRHHNPAHLIGGTGRYAGARGSGTLLEHGDMTGDLVFQLSA